MNTGENEQGLRKIIDMTRLISLALFSIHCYYYCYGAFAEWELTATIIMDRLLSNIHHTGLFNNFNISKLASLAFLFISLFGARGKKEEKLKLQTGLPTL